MTFHIDHIYIIQVQYDVTCVVLDNQVKQISYHVDKIKMVSLFYGLAYRRQRIKGTYLKYPLFSGETKNYHFP